MVTVTRRWLSVDVSVFEDIDEVREMVEPSTGRLVASERRHVTLLQTHAL